MQFLGSIFTPLALYTLGAQVAAARSVRFEPAPQVLILLLTFIVAPLLSWYLCGLMGLSDQITDVLLAASTPSRKVSDGAPQTPVSTVPASPGSAADDLHEAPRSA